jgi:hypothetical protein
MTLEKRRAAVCLLLLCLAIHTSTHAQVMVPGPPQVPVTWLIFVDDLHLDFRNTGRLRDALRKLTAEMIRDGDRFSVVSSGPSSLAVEVTTDREILVQSIRKVTGNALRFDDLFQPGGSAEALYRASTAVTVARSMLPGLEGSKDGPTALLYFSKGYSFELLPDSAPGGAQLVRGRQFTRALVNEQLQELIETARRAAVPIVAIHPRIAFGDTAALLEAPEEPAHQREMQRVLRSMADGTGGFALVDGDFVAHMRRVSDAIRR